MSVGRQIINAVELAVPFDKAVIGESGKIADKNGNLTALYIDSAAHLVTGGNLSHVRPDRTRKLILIKRGLIAFSLRFINSDTFIHGSGFYQKASFLEPDSIERRQSLRA